MRIPRLLALLLCTGVLWAGWLFVLEGGAVSARESLSPMSPDSPIQVLTQTPNSAIVEVRLPSWSVEPERIGDALYHRIQVPGMQQSAVADAPQLPTIGTLLGVSNTADLTVTILEQETEVLVGYLPPPAPRPIVDVPLITEETVLRIETTPDTAIYGMDGLYPAAPLTVQEGTLRDQPVVQVQFYPVRVNPARKEITLYRRLRVRIGWDVVSAATPQAAGDPVYETLLQQLLPNYAALQRPQPIAPRSPVPRGTLSETVTTTLKIGVVADGLYRLTAADLAATGLEVDTLDPRRLHLSNRGRPIPLWIPGEDDGKLDDGDALYFYGEAIGDSIYTDENVYWLHSDADEGLRMASRKVTPAGAAPAAHYSTTLHLEENTFYWQTMPDGWGEDHWFWGERFSGAESRSYTLPLSALASGVETATLRVRLKGYTNVAHTPDHHTRLYLNGHLLDDRTWDGQMIFDHMVMTVPHTLLQEGNNTVTIESVAVDETPVNQFLLNWIELSYQRRYVAENNQIHFGSSQGGAVEFAIAGFTSDEATLLDIIDPDNPVHLLNAEFSALDGSNHLRFQDDTTPDARYLALGPDQYRTPHRVVVEAPSRWRTPAQGAAYVLITHADFMASAERLAEHRQATGMSVALVDVADLYDEFNHGIFDPAAMRDFLVYAYEEWEAAPVYVTLLGDANQDYKDYLGTGIGNYVPTQIIETELLGETPSDNWFVTVSGDDVLPDLFIGRLSAQTPAQASAIIDKIIAYETAPEAGDWRQRTLLVADDNEFAFEFNSEQLASQLPHYYDVRRVYVRTLAEPTAAAETISQELNSGSVLVNYTGHGSVDKWGIVGSGSSGTAIYDNSHVNSLQNAGKLPLVTVANCLNGFFPGVSTTSIAETFQRLSGRGAIGVWAPTALNYPSGHRTLLVALYEGFFQQDLHGFGAATTAAKIAAYSQSTFWGELVETYVLFGDPVTTLAIPVNYPYLEHTTPTAGASDVPIDQIIELKFSKPMSDVVVALTDGAGQSLSLIAISATPDGKTVAYSTPLLAHGAPYTLAVSGMDHRNQPLGLGLVPATVVFTLTTDATPPSGSVRIGDGSTEDVPLSTTLTAEFSEPIRPDSVQWSLTPAPEGAWADWNDAQTLLTIHPGDLLPRRTYTFSVTAATDLAGNAMTVPVAQNFTTVAETHWLYLPNVGD